MQLVPLAALACTKIFGREAHAPVHLVALAYAVLVVATFIQALLGRPFIAY
jgi:hypothetical protein